MPSVASEANIAALKPAVPPAARPPSPSDTTQAAPFASLLDNNAQPSTPPASNAQSPAKSTDDTPAKNSDATNKTADAGKQGNSGTDAGNGETGTVTAVGGDKKDVGGKTAADNVAVVSDPTPVTGESDQKTGGKNIAADAAKTDAEATAQADAAKALQTPATVKDKPSDSSKTSDPDAAKSSDSGQVSASTGPAVVILPLIISAATVPAQTASKQTLVVSATTAKGQQTTQLAAKALSGDAAGISKDAIKEAEEPQGNAPAQSADGSTANADGNASSKPAAIAVQSQPLTAPHHADPANAQPPLTTSALFAGGQAGANSAPQLSMNALTHDAASSNGTGPAIAGQMLSQAPVPLNGVAVAIAGRALAGGNHFEIRLDPPELGRIDVRLDVDKDGSVTSHLIADNKDTLNLLQRDASGLQRALQDAGLKTSENGLQFSLRDQSTPQQQQNTAPAPVPTAAAEDEALRPIALPPSGYAQLARMNGGLDIRI